MRAPLAVVTAVAVAAGFAVGASGSASADLGVPEVTATPLPVETSVSLPVETALPLPGPTADDPVQDTVDTVSGTLPGGDGSDGSGGSSSGGTDGSSPTGPADSTGGTGAGTPDGTDVAAATTRAAKERARLARDATPMVAGTPAARDLLDDEHSPELLAASRDFLAADQGIADIAREKRILARLKQSAEDAAALYRAYGFDVLTAQSASDRLHERHDQLRRQVSQAARSAYVSGAPTADVGLVTGLAEALTRYSDGGTRADLRLGELTVRRAAVRAEFERIAERYAEAQRRLDDANQRLAALAAQRSTALAAVHAARGSDLALNQARIAESGELGSAIRAASAELMRTGRTVRGTGEFVLPLGGHVTSPFGMRRHPILGYTKLHTGTDFAGSGTIAAADRGRVLMTVTSTAYGLFTVIDHGVIDGRRVTTAYAHQSAFLVRVGQEVAKGDPIGVVGSTGYSTGPHLHFEVREDGAVVDPVTWLR